jgi:hypothetical protein
VQGEAAQRSGVVSLSSLDKPALDFMNENEVPVAHVNMVQVQQTMTLQSMLELRWPQHTCSAFGFASSTHGHHGYEDTLAHPTLSDGMAARWSWRNTCTSS